MVALAPPVQVVEANAPPFVHVPSGAPPFVVVTHGLAPPIMLVADGAPPITLLNEDGSIWSGGAAPAVGGAALLVDETDGFATDFTYATDASRVAKKVAGVVTEYGLDSFYSNSGIGSKLVYDVTGLLVWSPHNMALQSQTFEQTTPWNLLSNLTVTTNAIAAPDGTLTADRIVETATTANHAMLHANINVLSGEVYTYSVYAKAGERNWLAIAPVNQAPADWFDLTAGALGTTANGGVITSVGNGWYRCSITQVAPATTRGPYFWLRTANGQTGTYAGSTANGLYLWGAQVNRGATPSAYLPTTTVARYGLAIDYDPVTHVSKGLLCEPAASNACAFSNDFSQANWTKTNATATLTATAPTGITNSASILTATAGNATALQAITSTLQSRITSVFLKRRTGTGDIDITQDNGTTWTTQAVTSSWARYSLPTVSTANPTVGIRIVASGDAVDVALFQHETSTIVSSPIPSFAGGSRAANGYSVTAASINHSATAGSWWVEVQMLAAINGTRIIDYGIPAPIYQGSATAFSLSDGTVLAKTVTGTTGLHKVASAFQASDRALTADGLAVATDAGATAGLLAPVSINFGSTPNINGYIRKLYYLPRRMTNPQLVTATT